jgi:hypothetical protein
VSGNGAPKDKLAPAIAAAGQPAVQPLRQWAATITSTGRQAAILLPADATDGEIAEFCGWILSTVMNTYRAERAQSSGPRLVVPTRGTIVRA